MMGFVNALRGRRQALARSREARSRLTGATDELIGVYQARPLPVLASAVGIGFVAAQLRVGRSAVRVGLRIATGPGWRLVRQYLSL
ncbi:MAG TPA: hypothetical protein VFQ95_04930 [Rhodanobacteraceae bacterium]|nr:hypothetical protein [Rhodanobacteraceae bacterium]